jgi:hypothetical protein
MQIVWCASMDLREAYELAFTAPYASHRWRSIRGHRHWMELEASQDLMAGPLYAIVNTGGCGYVYAREDEYFVGVTQPCELHARLLEWHVGLVRAVDRFTASTPSQTVDLAYMRYVLAIMRDLIERGFEVERARWLSEQQTHA